MSRASAQNINEHTKLPHTRKFLAKRTAEKRARRARKEVK